MKALTYHGPHHVSVDNMPDRLLRQRTILFCASPRQRFTVRSASVPRKDPRHAHGDIFGHEFGEVVEAGSEVTAVRKGDRVVIRVCHRLRRLLLCRLQYAACESTNSGGSDAQSKGISPPAALFGYSDLYGGIPGGEAEYVRVPKANTGPFKRARHLTR